MYSIIVTADAVIVHCGTYRQFVLDGGRGELIVICKSKREVKQRIDDISKLYNKPIKCLFSLEMTRRDLFEIGKVARLFTDEHIAKMSAKKVGSLNPNYGGLKDEVKKKISAKLKGRSNFAGKKHRPESKAKNSSSHRGKKHFGRFCWIHDIDQTQERRIANNTPVPDGWITGRLPGIVGRVAGTKRTSAKEKSVSMEQFANHGFPSR